MRLRLTWFLESGTVSHVVAILCVPPPTGTLYDFLMDDGSDPFDVRRIEPGSADYLPALHLAVRDDSLGVGEARQTVADLLAAAERGSCSLDLVVGTYHRGRLTSAAVAVEYPGSACLLLFPSVRQETVGPSPNAALLQAARDAAFERSIKLVEALVAPDAEPAAQDLRRAGFRYLTQLIYLTRSCAPGGPTQTVARDVSWVSYAPTEEALFCRALELSYMESLDCPELTELRSTSDVLAGHRATGIFDASLWWVAMRSGEPVGIALLNRISSQRAMEIVYIGVAPHARGTGVADALMERMVTASRGQSAQLLTLAVDRRNEPARRMYRRWGFARQASLNAWIATVPVR